MFGAGSPKTQTSSGRFWRRILYLCLIWQLVVLLLAVASCTLGLRDAGSVAAADERRLVRSLLEPTDAERNESARFVSELRLDHKRAAHRWRAACATALGWPPIEKTLGLAPAWDDGPQAHAYTPEFDRRETPYLACVAVQNGLADEKLLDLLDARPRQPAPAGWARQVSLAKLMLLVMMRRYEDAEKLLGSSVAIDRAKLAALKRPLHALRQNPNDAEQTYHLLRAMREYLQRGPFTPALIGQTWGLYDRAESGAIRAESLGLLAELYGSWDKALDLEVQERLYVAAARTDSGSVATKEACARVVCDRAHYVSSKGKAQEAIGLFYAVTQHYPGTKGWGIAAFNAGTLLRQTGRPRQARAVLSQIFDSSANDRDPAPYIMSAYRNYQHRAAIEISRSYRDQLNLPAAYYWWVLAELKYPYQSWCGTCMWLHQSRMARERLWHALLAGPAFLVLTVALDPVRYWYLWLGVVGIYVGYRRVTRRRGSHRPAPSPQREHT